MSLLGALSAISLAHYSVEAFADEYPRAIWLGLTGAAILQLAASVFLFVRRSLLAAVGFLAVAIPLAILEQQTSIAVAFARNFLSIGAAIAGFGLLVALVATRPAEK